MVECRRAKLFCEVFGIELASGRCEYIGNLAYCFFQRGCECRRHHSLEKAGDELVNPPDQLLNSSFSRLTPGNGNRIDGRLSAQELELSSV